MNFRVSPAGTACSGACAKLSLGLGFHGCAHLSRLGNKSLLSLSSLGGYHWFRTGQLSRWRPVEDLTRDTSRSPPRPRGGTRPTTGIPRQMVLPRLRLLNACAVWLFPGLPSRAECAIPRPCDCRSRSPGQAHERAEGGAGGARRRRTEGFAVPKGRMIRRRGWRECLFSATEHTERSIDRH